MTDYKTLHYVSGEEIDLNDEVILDKSKGTIVFVISSNQYSSAYTKENWSYLKEGFGVETEKYGLIHQIKPDEDLVLINNQITTGSTRTPQTARVQ
jgi:hypothetical protein